MKFHQSEEMKARTISNLIVVVSGILLYAVIFLFRNIVGFIKDVFVILSPFIIGLVISFLLYAPARWLEELFLRVSKKKHVKRCRALSILTCYVLLFLLIFAFLILVAPQLYESIRVLTFKVRAFMQTYDAEIRDLLRTFNITGSETQNMLITWESLTSRSLDYIGTVLMGLMSMSMGIGNSLLRGFLGVALSIYMLFDRERYAAQGKKLVFAFIKREKAESIIYWLRQTNQIFSKFIAGKILETIAVGLICYVGMVLFRFEFRVLISVVVGMTNIVPIIGPWVGAAISALILLMVNPWMALWFLIFVIVIQQIDGNILGPRILGGTIGLSAFWIMLSIVVGGGFFGLPGMLLSIPVFALIYSFLRVVTEARLKRNGMPVDTADYYANQPPTGKDGEEQEGASS